jgi:phosphohistidine phosphatase
VSVSVSRRLLVLRHAKSSWNDPELVDHDRPLAPRGQRGVKLLADYMRRERIRPALVLCSSARRTVETYEGVRPSGELSIESGLYAADGDGLLERLRRIPDDIGSVMIIGHNPAVQTLVLRLAGANSGTGLGEVQRKFPTGSLATLAFDCAWSELGPGAAELVSLVRPRDLQ